MGSFNFYAKNAGEQPQIGAIDDRPGQRYNLRDEVSMMQNDEARSVVLRDVRAGAILRLFDDPFGRRDDDWTEILVKQRVSELKIPSFELTFETDTVQISYHHWNGLDGKVSRIEVD